MNRLFVETKLKRVLGLDGFDRGKFGRVRQLYRKARDRPRWLFQQNPVYVNLETTRKCNLRCRYCVRASLVDSGKLQASTMTDAIFQQVTAELNGTCGNVKWFVFSGIGEPLLDLDLFRRVDVLRRMFPLAKMNITTNGVLLNESRRADIIELLDSVTVSVNLHDPNEYREWEGADCFSVVVENVKALLREKRNGKPNVDVQLLYLPANWNRVEDFRRFWQPFLNCNDRVKLHELHQWTGKLKANVCSYDDLVQRYPCSQLWELLYFSVEGDVFPCCMGEVAGELRLGNVGHDSLGSMLQGERLKQIRLLHQFCNYPSSCVGCHVWEEITCPMFKVRSRFF